MERKSICARPQKYAIDRRGSALSTPARVATPLSNLIHISRLLTSTPCMTMTRKEVQRLKPTLVHEATPPQTGTKESPILLSSDDESEEEESSHRPLGVNAVPQNWHLGVSPSDVYTFTGHGSAYDMMIAMGYTPNSGLGKELRGSANSPYASRVCFACLYPSRDCAAPVD